MSQRIFIGIPIEKSVGQQLYNQVLENKMVNRALLYPLEKLHITVAFVGQVSDPLYDQLVNEIQMIATKMPAFSLKFKKVEILKPRSRPPLILALTDLSLELGRLYCQVRKSLSKLQIMTDKRVYRPHVTISRQADNIILDNTALKLSTSAERLVIYQSDSGDYIHRNTYCLSFDQNTF